MKNDQSQKDYQALFNFSKKIRLLESVKNLLEWDQETYMPKAAQNVRGEQLELLAGLAHKEKTSAQFGKLLGKLVDLETGKVLVSGLSTMQKAALREWRRDFRIACALPNSFIKSLAKHASESISVWTKARSENNFSLFAPYLKKSIDMCKEKAYLLGYKDHPYDALLDLHEPDMTTREVQDLFKKVKKGLEPLLEKIGRKKSPSADFLFGSFDKEKILKFCHHILKSMGYDFQKGRLDLSTHPFSMSLHPLDSRITTRIHNDSLFDPLSAALHEGGHGLYEMGMDSETFGSPLCEAASLGIHESQSRIWETRIGQSKPFWKAFLPALKKEFPELKEISLDAFYKALNLVKPTFIRVEADEVTYSLHVIIRFELEKQLIEGTLSVEDVPDAWNDLMEAYLGIRPTSDKMGCLQDIHWSMGELGYFPTYTLGNLYAAQFFETFQEEHPDWEEKVARGDLLFFRQWLKERIHQEGRLYRAKELIKKVSGKQLSEVPYLNYLNQKYAELYKF